MSPREWKERIADIIEAYANLQSFIEGMTFENFAGDIKTVRAVAYEVGVIGEATARLPLPVREAHSEIPWDKMQAMRNFVFHEYFRMDVGILWQTVTQNLPPLIPQLRNILAEAE
jgi:uncharacterized protein with HEPN domain